MRQHISSLLDDIRRHFPVCVTEAKGKDGQIRPAIDFDLLRQELSDWSNVRSKLRILSLLRVRLISFTAKGLTRWWGEVSSWMLAQWGRFGQWRVV